jgi:hypothetical protein
MPTPGGLCRAAPGGCAEGHRPDPGLVVPLGRKVLDESNHSMVAYLLDRDGRSTMGSSVGKISDHPGLTRGGSGAPVSRLGAWLLVALLLGLSIVGCGGDQGDVDKVTPQASTAPGGSSESESSPTSDQGSGSGSREASGEGAGSGPEFSATSNKSAGSGSTEPVNISETPGRVVY